MGCVTDIREVRVLLQFDKPRFIYDVHPKTKKSTPINQTHFNRNNMFYARHPSQAYNVRFSFNWIESLYSLNSRLNQKKVF